MPTQHTTTPSRKPLSGAQRRKERVARGLPKFTPAEKKHKQENDKLRSKKRYERLSKIVDDIKLSRGCADCGYNKHPAALHFDHLPGSDKVEIIARLSWAGNRQRLLKEIEKCEVVCANCHAIRTIERRNT